MLTQSPAKCIFRIKAVSLIYLALVAGNAFAAQAGAVTSSAISPAETVPAVLNQAKDLGPVAPDTDMKVTVWLKMRNEADFDKAVEGIYTPGSATYHKWMTSADLANYAVDPAATQTVKNELEAHGLAVTVGEGGLSLTAHGLVGSVESAFHTQIRNYSLNGRTLRANAVAAGLAGGASNMVAAVGGLSSSVVRPMLVAKTNSATGEAYQPKVVTPQATGLSAFVTSDCFKSPTALTFTTTGADLPVALYFGNVHDSGPSLACGYTPDQLAAVYGVDKAAKQGLQGEGQTIVIVDAFGSPSILADANLFSALAGLPKLDSSNFEVIYPGGMPVFDPKDSNQQSWAEEVAIDVEWSHALAPKAKIVLVAAISTDDLDVLQALQYATVHHLGDVISNSYGSAEALSPVSTLKANNRVIKLAAAMGIAVNVSSGDDGDYVISDQVVTVSSPSDSPFATSVGGTSLNVPSGKGLTTTGWGNNLTRITSATGVYDPPVFLGFVGGSGGGESSVFNKPSYQKLLPGSSRQQPDVSAIADPYTGVPVVFTLFSSGDQVLGVFGGTSVASPVFSAIWSLADQLAGVSLGQAAPIIAQLSAPALFDVLPVKSPGNVTGVIGDSTGATSFLPADLVPIVSEPKFVSALYPVYSGSTISRWDILSFGTDSSLRIEKGWDNVTGYGTPGGYSFFTEAASYK